MEQHAVPRQITTFEFKLIGFLTIKQFGYLVFFALIAVFFYFAMPFPLNIIIAVLAFLIGVFIVFVPINDRPVDIWIKNMFRKLFSPSQYFYHKKNAPPDFLKNVFIYPPPQIIASHIDAQNKLASYLTATKQAEVPNNNKKQQIQNMIASPPVSSPSPVDTVAQTTPLSEEPIKSPSPAAPALSGVIRNSKNLGLPNIMIYIKDKSGRLVRILKTNHNLPHLFDSNF